jgi:hypothetical protein|tara:strand:- start:3881 stop:4441 length:561 start_codon:yes stop_codon:yes gene_type:complete
MELDINLLVGKRITPNSYVYLYYLVHNMINPITMDIDLKSLESKGFIKIMDTQVIARNKAKQLIEGEPYVYQEEVYRVEEWIQEWRELFPKGIKSGGHLVRGSKQGCIKKMKAFVNKNKDVTKDKIFKATSRYLSERRTARYSYCKVADYFISKDSMSMLESYIEQLESIGVSDFDTNTNNMTQDV